MCCTATITPSVSQFTGRRDSTAVFTVPICIAESAIADLQQYVAQTNTEEVIFLGKNYPPQTLRFLKFTPRECESLYFYGDMLLDFQAHKAVGQVSFLPLQELVHG